MQKLNPWLKKSSKPILEWIIKYLIYLTFFIPLIVLPKFFLYPFIFPKIIIFRSVVILLALNFSYLLMNNWGKYAPKSTPLSLSIFIFLISYAISSFFGVDKQHSLFDTQERMIGFASLLYFFVYFLICSQIFREWDDWKKAFNLFLFAGLIAMLWGWINPYQNFYPLRRVVGTLGNPNFLAGFSLFVFFSALLLFLEVKKSFSRFYYAFCVVTALVILSLTGSRGGTFALLLGCLLTLITYSILKKSQKERLIISCFTASLLMLAALMYISVNVHNPAEDRHPIQRLFNISQEDLSSPRIMAWHAALKGWKERPFLGWGPNTFNIIWATHYNPSSLRFGVLETHFDNAHNVLLDILTSQGLLGLICYISIYILAFLTLYRGWKRGAINNNFFLVSIGFISAHFVINLTSFENPTSYLYFFFWLAAINSLVSFKKEIAPSKPQAKMFLVLPPIVAIFLFVDQAYLPAIANHSLFSAVKCLHEERGETAKKTMAIEKFKELIQDGGNYLYDDTYFLISKIIVDRLEKKRGTNNKKEQLQLAQVAQLAVEKSLKAHPLDIQTYLLKGKINTIQALITDQKKFFYSAKDSLVKGLQLSPNYQQLIYHLAFVEIYLDNKEEASDLFKRAISLDPEVALSYTLSIHGYKMMGINQKAIEVLQQAKDRGVVL